MNLKFHELYAVPHLKNVNSSKYAGRDSIHDMVLRKIV